jgi:lysozyme
MTLEEAEKLLRTDLQVMETRLNSKKMDLTQNQFDALISFIFNCGFSAFQGSTLLKRITTGTGSIPEAFAMWNKCNGKILKGLILRRSAESKLYLS